ncbi:MAG TPA: hypothetical protein VEE84_09575 [Burkholderiaceae bacterium]|nr:hypothetical protein [Burkholderiaceae bacterium]
MSASAFASDSCLSSRNNTANAPKSKAEQEGGISKGRVHRSIVVEEDASARLDPAL